MTCHAILEARVYYLLFLHLDICGLMEVCMKGIKGIKPSGWWTTHPTLLTASVHGLVDGNGDGLGDFEGLRGKLDFFLEMGISGFRLQHVGLYGDDYKWSGLVQQDWYDVDPHYGTWRTLKD
jgi:hypothetical protein